MTAPHSKGSEGHPPLSAGADELLPDDGDDTYCAECGRATQMLGLNNGTVLCWDCATPRLKDAELRPWPPSPPPDAPPCALCRGEPCQHCGGPEARRMHLAAIPSEDPRYCWMCALRPGFQERRRMYERRRKDEAEALEERQHRERVARLADPTVPIEMDAGTTEGLVVGTGVRSGAPGADAVAIAQPTLEVEDQIDYTRIRTDESAFRRYLERIRRDAKTRYKNKRKIAGHEFAGASSHNIKTLHEIAGLHGIHSLKPWFYLGN
jgi:hypothetical protein